MPLSRKLAQLIAHKKISVTDVVEALHTYNLLSLLPQILKSLKQVAREKHTHDTLFVESPFILSEKALSHIKKLIGNDAVPHEITINPKLLAGFKARFKGTLYDGSAARIIKQLTN